MKVAFALIALLVLVGVVRASTAVLWWPVVENEEVEIGKVGDVTITVRPVPPPKEKDPPRVAVFLGEKQISKTPIYPGKRYDCALLGKDGKTQFYLNGFPDGPAADEPLDGGLCEAAIEDMKISGEFQSGQDILDFMKEGLPQRAKQTITVAHRGVHMHAPENTKISYVQALQAGAPILELDTALSKDGHIVLMHDKTVDRTTDGSGAVAELTLEQLKQLDAGSWKDPKYKGEPVPTLDDIASIARGKAILMLDLKAVGQGKAIADWLASSQFPKDQVLLAPWEDAEGVALRMYLPDIPMIRLTSKVPTETVNDAYFAKMKQIGFSGFSVNWQWLTSEFVAAAQRNGMKVYTWTLNDPREIAGALIAGVDGLITDDTAATKKLIADLTVR